MTRPPSGPTVHHSRTLEAFTTEKHSKKKKTIFCPTHPWPARYSRLIE